MEDVTAKVARQYTDYAYPKPVDDLAASAASGGGDYSDPSLFGPMLWPEGQPRPDLDILVAGCGTQQAAMIAFGNPSARVVGVDLSDASLGHQRYLRDKHALTNLELHQGDLREVGSLNRKFDLVVSTGVLHHMANPGEGLAALRDVLKPDGAMALMVYGSAGRRGVYPLQDAFRRMGLDQSPASVAVVRDYLDALPRDHSARVYVARTSELKHDTAIVDTFLHPQDQAYSVPELLDWIETAGLQFQTWLQNHLYYPEALVPDPVLSRIQMLPERDQWAVVEAWGELLGVHLFVARHAGHAALIDFEGNDWLSYKPRLLVGTRIEAVQPDGSATLRLHDIHFAVSPAEHGVLLAADGARTISEILSGGAFSAFPRADLEAFARLSFSRFWRIGVVMFEGVPAPAKGE